MNECGATAACRMAPSTVAIGADFVTYADRPASSERYSRPSSLTALSITTPRSGATPRNWRAVAIPSASASIASIVTTLALVSATTRTASAAVPASPTSSMSAHPAITRASPRRSRTCSSTATSWMVIDPPRGRGPGGSARAYRCHPPYTASLGRLLSAASERPPGRTAPAPRSGCEPAGGRAGAAAHLCMALSGGDRAAQPRRADLVRPRQERLRDVLGPRPPRPRLPAPVVRRAAGRAGGAGRGGAGAVLPAAVRGRAGLARRPHRRRRSTGTRSPSSARTRTG